MSDLNLLFRRRIGLQDHEEITFENLSHVLEKTAKAIPFENLSIIKDQTTEITKENLIDKIITRNEGGVCYELNSILYLFLLENGFDLALMRGVIYNHHAQQWNTTGRTHVTILLRHNREFYIVDTGFGGNLPLKPVPLNGKTILSSNGEFRLENTESEHGDYIFYMKLKNKDKEWKRGYAFYSSELVTNMSQLNEVQEVIRTHPDSPFNKHPLITQLTNRGSITLTETSFTKWLDVSMEKTEIAPQQFAELAEKYFEIPSH